MQLLAALLLLANAWLGQSQDPPRVSVPAGASWALLAWGWRDGGEDSVVGAEVVIVDMDSQGGQIQALRAAGHTVICYISTGTLEPFRDDTQANEARWREAAVGQMQQWDEEWLDITKLNLLAELMNPRFDRAVALGCQGVEPDNVDCYDNSECFNRLAVNPGNRASARAAQIVYNQWQVDAAHSRGLAIALKNALDLVDDMVSEYDFAVNEQCMSYSECGALEPFIDEGKAVLHVEYTTASNRCAQATQFGLSTKYCAGSNSAGICQSGAWINCFGSAPVNPTPKPVAQPTQPTTASVPTAFPTVALPTPTAAPSVLTISLPPTAPGGSAPWGLTWANLAWGWSDGGRDSPGGVQALLVDLDFFPAAEMQAARARGQLVICYFSGGTAESFRPDVQANAAQWARASLVRMARWPEDWLDIEDLPAMQALMAPRLARAVAKGCDGVEPDNVDCLSAPECRAALANPSRARETQIAYNRWLASAARRFGLLVALKNCAELVVDLVNDFDLSVVESCARWNVCDMFRPFQQQNKAILATDYELTDAVTQCAAGAAAYLSLKICDGAADMGLCAAGQWHDCFTRAGGFIPPPPPPPPKVWMPESPVAWANDGGFGGANATATPPARDESAGSQLVVVNLHDGEARVRALVRRGHHVICSFSAGALEPGLPDAADLASVVVTNGARTRQGLAWLNVGADDAVAVVRRVAGKRLDAAAAMGCHGVLPRDVDCYETRNCRRGWGLGNMNQRRNAEPFQLAHNAWLAERATARGLLIGLFGTPSLADDLVDSFDFVVTEACVARQNCNSFVAFLDAGKPVLNLEFAILNDTCAAAVDAGVDTKMCEGRLGDRVCDDGSPWANCFAAVSVTPWPTPAPAEGDEGLLGSGMTMLMWMSVIIGVPLAGLALIVGALRRRRRRHLLLLGAGADGIQRHAPTVAGLPLYGASGLSLADARGGAPVRSWFDIGPAGRDAAAAKTLSAPPLQLQQQQQQQEGAVSYSTWLRQTAVGAHASWSELSDNGQEGQASDAAQPKRSRRWLPWRSKK